MSQLKENKKDRFILFVLLSVIVIILLIVLFIFLTNFVKPHISIVEINGDKQSASFTNQRLKIYFSRPMKKDTLKGSNKIDNALIQINPNANYTLTWVGNTLFIIFNDSLQSSTQYSVKISKELKDLYDTSLNEDYTYLFKTKTPQIAYIEKTYASTKSNIVISDYNFENKKNLYSDDGIKFFGLNSLYLVTVIEKNKVDDISVINLSTNKVKKLELINVKINSLDLSQNTNKFVYTSQEVLVRDQYTVPKPGKYSQVFIYNLENDESTIFNPKNTAQDVSEVKFSRDGKNIIYKAADSFYYLANIDKQDSYSSIGRFLAFGSFNKDESKIVFVNYDPLQTYTKDQFILEFSSDRTIKNLTNGDVPVLDPTYFNNDDKIIFSEKSKDLERTKGIYKIVLSDLKGNHQDIYHDNQRSLELPKISYDDRYIMLERYNELDLLNLDNQREFGSQNKPAFANLIIYDQKEDKLIDKNIIGIEGIWIK